VTSGKAGRVITAYRIEKKKFAEFIWSGLGARQFGGRWNSKGIAVVYTAENRSLAAIEQLVHLARPHMLSGFVIASISFRASQVRRIDSAGLPAGWNDPVAPPSLKKYGDDWVAAGKRLVLAVPSAVMPTEWNYLLNPAHPEFGGLVKSAVTSFFFDPRFGRK
jgi:RES domain-containing protein